MPPAQTRPRPSNGFANRTQKCNENMKLQERDALLQGELMGE